MGKDKHPRNEENVHTERPPFLKPTTLEKVQPPTHTAPGLSPSFPYSTSHAEPATAPEETAQAITGSLEDYKTHVLYTEEKNPFFTLAYTQLLLMPLNALQRPTFRLKL